MDAATVTLLKQCAARDDALGIADVLRRCKVAKDVSEVVFDGKKWSVFVHKADVTTVVNQRFESGFTLLHFVAECGASKCLQYLCQLGASVDVTTDSGMTPIHLAVDSGHLECTQQLIRYHANLNSADGWLGNSSLHWAVRRKNVDIVRLLLQHGASVNLQNNEGNTPLHLAAKEGLSQIVEILISKRADANIMNDSNQKPIDLAMKNKHSECVVLLKLPPPSRPKSIREEEKYSFPQTIPSTFTHGEPKHQGWTDSINLPIPRVREGSISSQSSNRLTRSNTAFSTTSFTTQPTTLADSRSQRSQTVWSSSSSLRSPSSPTMDCSQSVMSFSSSSRSLVPDHNPGVDDVDYQAEIAKFDAIVHNFTSNLSTWQDLVSYIMRPASQEKKTLCMMERESSLNGVFRFHLKWEKDTRKSLLLQSFKRLSSTTPNFPIGLSQKDISERNTSGYMGKLRGNGARTEYIAFDSGLNPDRKSSIGRRNTRSGLATVKLVDPSSRKYSLTVPNPNASSTEPEYLQYEAIAQSQALEGVEKKKENVLQSYQFTRAGLSHISHLSTNYLTFMKPPIKQITPTH
eukprot:TRINITY_DN4898_c0_g1_i2.p1 TRINITY_DN4898_c0_g1~~TRINITY_DN4898_c0_g1_i2.p1  ORF type:complete len:574 (+),score=100.99 TRINITY_DN4898_c0_g1_i2:61-1782(+)